MKLYWIFFSLYSDDSILSLSRHSIAMDLGVMLLTGITAYVVLIIIELGAFRVIKLNILKFIARNHRDDDDELIDDDVLAEKMRIDQMTLTELQSEAVVMQGVLKAYGAFDAVKNISLSVKRYLEEKDFQFSVSIV